jgi:hypothetical protein
MKVKESSLAAAVAARAPSEPQARSSTSVGIVPSRRSTPVEKNARARETTKRKPTST